ncbi:hypothetical protein JW926_10440, partial [Candidatus Sumerlaeota bacterium]|nr:hypothetical protein [Candidatus Sumerlaeota bacterium]
GSEITKIPAFSLLHPQNIRYGIEFLNKQISVLDEFLRKRRTAPDFQFRQTLVGVDYDVINKYMFPFLYFPEEEKERRKEDIHKKSLIHSQSITLLTLFKDILFIPLGTSIDIAKALEFFSRKAGIARDLHKIDDTIENIEPADISEHAMDVFNQLFLTGKYSILSKNVFDSLEINEWLNGVYRLRQLLIPGLSEKDVSKTRWKHDQIYREDMKIHEPTFKMTLDYLDEERSRYGREFSKISNIADALSMAQMVGLILKDRNNDLSIPPGRTSIEYLFVTNTPLLLLNKYKRKVIDLLRSQFQRKGKFYYQHFILSSQEFLYTRTVSEQPGAPANITDLTSARETATALQTALINASQSPLWRHLRDGDHQCANVLSLITFFANMARGLPQALSLYIKKMEEPLFVATAGTRALANQLSLRYLNDDTVKNIHKSRINLYKVNELLEGISELSFFLNKQFPRELRASSEVTMEHLGLKGTDVYEDKKMGILSSYIYKMKSGKEQDATEIEEKDIWLKIVKTGDHPPEIYWPTESGPIEALSVAKNLETYVRQPVFQLDDTACLKVIDKSNQEYQTRIQTFKNEDDILTSVLRNVKQRIALKQVQCVFYENGPVVSVGPQRSEKQSREQWAVHLINFPWEKGSAHQNADWIMNAFKGTYFTTLTIIGLRKWIEGTLKKMMGDKA